MSDLSYTIIRSATIAGVAVFALFVGFMLGMSAITPHVGSTKVPNWLQCEEDEAIAFDPNSSDIPRPLTCVSYEEISDSVLTSF